MLKGITHTRMSRKWVKFSVLTLGMIFLSGCVANKSEMTEITQLQVREIQTREYDICDTKLVMKSMMNVLQDDGYIIKNAVVDLGLLSAEKNIDVEKTGEAIMLTLLIGQVARWNKHMFLEASGNVSEYGSKTRVRMNFQTKTIDNFGCPQIIKTIHDVKFYQDFFDKVSKGIFIEQQGV